MCVRVCVCVCVYVCVAVHMHFELEVQGRPQMDAVVFAPDPSCLCQLQPLQLLSCLPTSYTVLSHTGLLVPLFYLSPLFFFPRPFLHPSPALPRSQCLAWNTFPPSTLLDKAQCFRCGLNFLVNNQATVIAWFTVFPVTTEFPGPNGLCEQNMHMGWDIYICQGETLVDCSFPYPHWAQAKLLF